MSSKGWQKALLRPDTIALVGVSDDPLKTSGRPLKFLRAAGYAGKVYSINPNRDTVQGEAAYRSLSDLPEVPEHAFILTGAQFALDALEECERLGVPVATVLATGFAEAGAAGAENLARLSALTGRGKLRVLGPSSIGLANLHHGMTLTANAAFAESDLPKGGLFVASHSGSLIGALMSRGKRKGLGFAGLVSVGGEGDLAIGDVCMAALDDPDRGHEVRELGQDVARDQDRLAHARELAQQLAQLEQLRKPRGHKLGARGAVPPRGRRRRSAGTRHRR